MLSPVALKFSPWVRQLISLMFIALMVVKASATVQCTLSSLSPSMGPHSGGTTVSINVACNTDDGELMNKLFDSVRAYFGFTQTSILSVSYTGFVTTHNTGFDEPPQIAWTYSVIVIAPVSDASTIVLTSLLFFPEPPNSDPMLTVEGALPYQYYNVSDLKLSLRSTGPILSTGGQTLCVDINRFSFVLEYSISKLKFSLNNQIFIEYTLEDMSVNTTDVSLCTLLDSRLEALVLEPLVRVDFAPNGVDYEFLQYVKINSTVPKTSLVFLDEGDVSLNTWSLTHSFGMTKVTSLFSTSLKTYYQKLRTNVYHSFEEISAIIDSKGPVDIVFYVAFFDPALIVELADRYKTTSFLGCVPKYTSYDDYTRLNINYYWAEIYQGWFLSGYLAGLMLEEKGGDICYVKTYNNTYNTLLLNSFSYGVQMAKPNATVRYWISNTETNSYVLQQMSTNMLHSRLCSQIATTASVTESVSDFTSSNKYASMVNIDASPTLGPYILSSTLTNWTQVYEVVLRMKFNELLDKANNSFISLSYNDNSIYLSQLSPNVSPDIASTLQIQAAKMANIGAMSVVLCGPVIDTQGNVQIAAGQCPTYKQLYTMDWDINNTVFEGIYVALPPKFDDNSILEAYIIASYAFLVLFTVIFIGLAIWTYKHQDHPIVKFSQPGFLYLVLFGSFIGIVATIPLGYTYHISDQEAFDLQSDGIANISDESSDIACQAVPWLIVTAFGLTFAVLMAKTWRLHKLLSFLKKRLAVNMKPLNKKSDFEYGIILFLFVLYIPMILWQVLKPIKYTITVTEMDVYGNPVSSRGSCYDRYFSDTYGILVLCMLLGICLCGNILCFLARNDDNVNHDTTYISLGILNYFQVDLVATLLVLVTTDPSVRFAISTSAVFIAFGGLVCLIFIPKIFAVEFEGDHDTITITTKRTLATPGSFSGNNLTEKLLPNK